MALGLSSCRPYGGSMAEIAVVGAGFTGLTTALLLADDGHRVTLIERDDASPPSDPFIDWERRGVPQLRQPHVLLARGRQLLAENLPEALAAIEESGCPSVNATSCPPPMVTDRESRPGDEDLVAMRGRRAVFEPALRSLVMQHPRIELMAGAGVARLAAHEGQGGRPQVTGLVTEDGAEVSADLTVVASGRRTPLASWLAEIGARPFEEDVEPTGQVYLMRWLRCPPDFVATLPTLIGGNVGWCGLYGFPGDAGWVALGLGPDASDEHARQLRDPKLFERFAATVPAWQPVIDQAETMMDPIFMGSLHNHLRRFVVDGEPVASGMVAVGDSRLCTNPSYGRGMSLGLMQSVALRDALSEGLVAGVETAVDDRIERECVPWFEESVASDRCQAALRRSVLEGEEVDALSHPATAEDYATFLSAGTDADIYRRLVRVNYLLEPFSYLRDDPHTRAQSQSILDSGMTAPAFGPARKELVDLVST